MRLTALVPALLLLTSMPVASKVGSTQTLGVLVLKPRNSRMVKLVARPEGSAQTSVGRLFGGLTRPLSPGVLRVGVPGTAVARVVKPGRGVAEGAVLFGLRATTCQV
jgi:hypothetical protein